jgi:signal transduction histidine kinase
MAANYNKDSPTGIETIVTIFDHTTTYGQDDEAISFIALAVHELRNPLTMLRGYIDVFEEELDGKLSDELADFMRKMQVAAGTLAAFVNNILNVARIENDQLVLELSEQNWIEVVNGAIEGLKLRAQIHKKTIEFVHPTELPTVCADSVSIYEVLSNILDNAIKYSGEEQKKIIVSTILNKEGLVETTIQDFGPGIPSVLLPNLFEKFYRNHRTQSQVGGTGLGLYLSKAIITAHGGQIWVKSKEGEGTTFGFTLLPFSTATSKMKPGDNNGIVRGAHGWIKNHSLYRR